MRSPASLGEILTSEQAMCLAIEIASGGAGFVAPNPLVGCVILDRDSRLIGQGFHSQVGAAHAEIEALNPIRDPESLRDATVYVTLEPCAHHGRTPPCAATLANLPIARVVYGLPDPNPLVAGKGLAILEAAGKKVERIQGLDDKLEDLAEIFLHNMREKRPFVAIKVATTLDGQMGLTSGESRWISGQESREHVHYLRGCYDSIMVGKRTFLIDDPRLNVRHPRFVNKKNKAIVLDPNGEGLGSLAKSRLRESHDPQDIIWVVDEKVRVGADVSIWRLPRSPEGHFDLRSLGQLAFAQGITSILVEGGPHLLGRWLAEGLAQRWYQFIAPDLLGAWHGLQVGSGWGAEKLAKKIGLERVRWQFLGRDLFVTGRLS